MKNKDLKILLLFIKSIILKSYLSFEQFLLIRERKRIYKKRLKLDKKVNRHNIRVEKIHNYIDRKLSTLD